MLNNFFRAGLTLVIFKVNGREGRLLSSLKRKRPVSPRAVSSRRDYGASNKNKFRIIASRSNSIRRRQRNTFTHTVSFIYRYTHNRICWVYRVFINGHIEGHYWNRYFIYIGSLFNILHAANASCHNFLVIIILYILSGISYSFEGICFILCYTS